MSDEQKVRAAAWFTSLQGQLIGAFEALEDDAPGDLYPGAAGRFERFAWRRGDGTADEGGGVGALMRGRFFEKVGVHFSEVRGVFSPEMVRSVPGAAEDPSFWACGVSLIAHLRNPHCPSAHMNTRHIRTQVGWFGGGGDLNPTQAYQRDPAYEDAVAFHAAFKATCDTADPHYFDKFKAWCDDYFWLPHRNEPRGVGGIFYDHLNTQDWEADFAFTQAVGKTFLATYPAILRRRMGTPWTTEDRRAQLIQRGRYVEFNLLYDRGTVFGLKTGGNIETILSSMPPEVLWP
ncbi:MAG: oxygen-dependent coproporphyrinogen oxidase [Caulobacterales bacterium]|jgi:coproporphyrinogen III oxidase